MHETLNLILIYVVLSVQSILLKQNISPYSLLYRVAKYFIISHVVLHNFYT